MGSTAHILFWDSRRGFGASDGDLRWREQLSGASAE